MEIDGKSVSTKKKEEIINEEHDEKDSRAGRGSPAGKWLCINGKGRS